MLDVNYEYYRAFYMAARYRSFTKAARFLHSNQPNITRTIRKLEEEAGCSLFIRQNRGIELTPEGEKLYRHVAAAIEQIQLGEEELEKERELQAGMITLGTSEIALHCALLPRIREFRKLYPGVRIRLLNLTSPQAPEAVRNGRTDFAVISTPVSHTEGLEIVTLRKIEEVPVCGEAYADLKDRTLTVQELSEYPVISLGRETSFHSFYSLWFAKNEAQFLPEVEAATTTQILPMAECGLGIGFVPVDFLQEQEWPHIHRLQLQEPVPEREICLIKRQNQRLSIAAEKLIGILSDGKFPAYRDVR